MLAADRYNTKNRKTTGESKANHHDRSEEWEVMTKRIGVITENFILASPSLLVFLLLFLLTLPCYPPPPPPPSPPSLGPSPPIFAPLPSVSSVHFLLVVKRWSFPRKSQ